MKFFRHTYRSITLPFLAGIFCIALLSARQAVFFLHKCDHMNTGIISFVHESGDSSENHIKSNDAEQEKTGHCHSKKTAASQEDGHDHHSCPICYVYEQLLQGAAVQTLFVYSAETANVSQISPEHLKSIYKAEIISTSARDPPFVSSL